MSKLNLKELRAKAAKIAKENKAKIQEAAEIGKLEAIIKLESNTTLLAAKAKMLMVEQDTNQLQSLIQQCAEIISSTPIVNSKTRENRKWAGKHRYGYGTQVDALYELATGIMYSCQDHKVLLLAHTGLSMQVLTELVESFGNPAYYSVNNNIKVSAQPIDLEQLLASIQILQTDLSVIINTSKLTQENITAEYLAAEIKADLNYEQAQEAISEADFEL